EQVPVVAIMTTGGGTRALTAMYAHLLSMQEMNVLDCVSYITGLSGTTWSDCELYYLNHQEKAFFFCRGFFLFLVSDTGVRKRCFTGQSGRDLLFHHEAFPVMSSLCHPIVLSYCHFSKQEDCHKLTDQQQALNQGQNPLPIYLSLNVKDKISDQDFREWVEFTPYEVGFPKYGAYIRAEDFGSEFFMGRLMKKIPESRICFLEGIWSSVFSLNLMDAWYISVNSEDFWHKWTRDK
ncbi:PA24E phospholipase, partial [Drymodes brunneopygia]|nr:PA24E phospholipase [Drymodes brunneopygia]